MKEIKCSVCSGTGEVHYWVCGVDVTDSCPICNGLGIIPLELHEIVEMQSVSEVRHDPV